MDKGEQLKEAINMYRLIKNLIKKIIFEVRKVKITFWKLHYYFRYKEVKSFTIDKTSSFQKNVRLLLREKGYINIGIKNNFQYETRIVINGGGLKVGKHCSFGEFNIINAFDDVIIGDNVLTADRVGIISNIHQYENVEIPICNQETTSGPIRIGNGCWLGINSTVLANTEIGKNCVIAAHAVVKGKYPDNCIIAGVPAKIVRCYDDQTGQWIKPVSSN